MTNGAFGQGTQDANYWFATVYLEYLRTSLKHREEIGRSKYLLSCQFLLKRVSQDTGRERSQGSAHGGSAPVVANFQALFI